MQKQKLKYKDQTSGGRVGKKEEMDVSALTSSSAIADKQNIVCKVDKSRKKHIIKTVY